MTFLVLAIACSTTNHLLFKAFARYRIDLLGAIVVNYSVCLVIGAASSVTPVFRISLFTRNWYPVSIVQGIILVVCLFLIGRTAEKQGVAVTSLATRLSVAIPTAAAFFLYGDMVTTLKIMGIPAALLALYLSSGVPTGSAHSFKTVNILPITLFVFFGAHSTLLKFVQERFLDKTSYHTYTVAAFLSAFLISGAVLAWRLAKKRQTFRWKELVWGFVLGCTNYGSIYFLIRALSVPGRESSQLFPTISIAVVGLSSLGAWFIFDERPGGRLLGALAIGAAAIALVNLG
jgi:drug/metabolite transporter (DMT)-like permease